MGVPECERVCVGVCGYTCVCADVRRCAWMYRDVCGYAEVCAGV